MTTLGNIVIRVGTFLGDCGTGDISDRDGDLHVLGHVLAGAWSRRIDGANRLVYYVTDEHVVILQARDHY